LWNTEVPHRPSAPENTLENNGSHKKREGLRGAAQVVKHLPSNNKVLNSNSSAEKNREKKKNSTNNNSFSGMRREFYKL
jgi:hypothetical protein